MRSAILLGAMALSGLVAAADACAPEFTSIPDDASLRLTFPQGRRITAMDSGRDSLPVVAEVRIGTGELAGRKWRIELSTDIGSFDASGTSSVAVLTTTECGTAVAFYFPTRDTGWVHLTVIGGGVKAMDSVHVERRAQASVSSGVDASR